jgi:hypothetical protein
MRKTLFFGSPRALEISVTFRGDCSPARYSRIRMVLSRLGIRYFSAVAGAARRGERDAPPGVRGAFTLEGVPAYPHAAFFQ